jgi:hypothetical protein
LFFPSGARGSVQNGQELPNPQNWEKTGKNGNFGKPTCHHIEKFLCLAEGFGCDQNPENIFFIKNCINLYLCANL